MTAKFRLLAIRKVVLFGTLSAAFRTTPSSLVVRVPCEADNIRLATIR